MSDHCPLIYFTRTQKASVKSKVNRAPRQRFCTKAALLGTLHRPVSGSDVLCAEEAEADKHQMFATKSVNVLIQVHEAERYICADEVPQSAFTNET